MIKICLRDLCDFESCVQEVYSSLSQPTPKVREEEKKST